MRIFDNAPTISNTIVDEQDNLNATLLAATGLANNGTDDTGAGGERLHRGDSTAARTVEGGR